MKLRRNKQTLVVVLICGGLLVAGLLIASAVIEDTNGTTPYVSGSSGTTRSLSESDKQQIYRDMISAESQNPFVRGTNAYDEYTKGVLQGTSEAHDMPIDQINEILDEGISKHWSQP